MRRFIGPNHAHQDAPCTDACYEDVPDGTVYNETGKETLATEDTTDGFHTFGELYAHRRALTAVIAAYAATQQNAAWRSKAHHPDDDPMFDGGWFIVGISLDTGPISYHYELKYWDDFAFLPEVEHAPKWDGHTADDVVTRLTEQAREIGAWRAP